MSHPLNVIPPKPVASSDPVLTADLACPECGYSLRGISSEKCPECGLAIDWATLSVSRLPWVHRRTIGRWRAYSRTNLLVIFRPKKLAGEMNRPVSFADAQRFRHVTVLLAWVPLPVLCAAVPSARFDLFPSHATHLHGPGWWMEGFAVLAAMFACWLALYLQFRHPLTVPRTRCPS